jgi:hypothetical protein
LATSVFIPWRPATSRLPAFDFTRDWWRSQGFDVHLVDSDDRPFSLAASRNLAVALSSVDPLAPIVISDADTVGEFAAIAEALERTDAEERTFLPYTEYRSLGEAGTAQALAGRQLELCSHLVYPPAVSGIYITTPAVWTQYGGQDPRFRGWLGEDIAHMHAHETLIGPLGRTQGKAYALGHDSEVKEGPQYDANAQLMHRYGAAAGDVDAMWALINER